MFLLPFYLGENSHTYSAKRQSCVVKVFPFSVERKPVPINNAERSFRVVCKAVHVLLSLNFCCVLLLVGHSERYFHHEVEEKSSLCKAEQTGFLLSLCPPDRVTSFRGWITISKSRFPCHHLTSFLVLCLLLGQKWTICRRRKFVSLTRKISCSTAKIYANVKDSSFLSCIRTKVNFNSINDFSPLYISHAEPDWFIRRTNGITTDEEEEGNGMQPRIRDLLQFAKAWDVFAVGYVTGLGWS